VTRIRAAEARDAEAIAAVHEAAFGRPDEARLARALAAREPRCISLVAERDGAVVGHLLVSPVSVDGYTLEPPPFGLGPLAVTPRLQRGGIGGALSRAGIEACRARGAPFVVVLGHPAYYPKFGFVPASRFGLHFGTGPARDAFMALELAHGALAKARGRVRYAREFGEG